MSQEDNSPTLDALQDNTDTGKEKNNSEIEKKLTLRQIFANTVYSLKLARTYSKPVLWSSLFIEIARYAEWIFYSGFLIPTVVEAMDFQKPFNSILPFVLIFGAIFCVMSFFTHYTNNVIYPLEMVRLCGGIYKKLFAKARNVELRCYEDSDFYDRYTMAMDGAEEKVFSVVRNLFGVIAGAVALAIVFLMMFMVDHWVVLFIAAPLIGNFVFGNFKQKYEYKRYLEQVPNNKVLNYVGRMMYLPDGAKELRLSRVFNLLKKQYSGATKGNENAAKKYAFANASLNFWRITFSFTIVFEGVLLYFGYRNLVDHTVTSAQLQMVINMMVAFTWISIIVFGNMVDLLKNAMFVNNLRSFLEYEEKIPQDQDGVIPDEFCSLEFKNVCFSYEEEETIRDLSFSVKKDDIVALVGHNGAGKTTIIKLLLRFYDPTSGEICLNGRNIKEYNLKAYRRLFATTFQDFTIFSMSVKENVLMGRHYENEDEIVHRSLRRAGILEKVESLPKGVDTVMTKEFDENGAVFSGGQHQKLAVARTFAKESPVKIFDEPSSALDPIAEYELFKNILKEGRDHTMIFISHRLSSVKHCDKVFMLEKGQIIESGSHKELLEQKGKYAEMYLRQAMNYLAIENEEEVKL